SLLRLELLLRAVRDSFQPGTETVERARGELVLLLRVRKMDAELAERLFDLIPETRELRELLADLARALLELQTLQSHRDGREVCEEKARRHRDDAAFERVVRERRLASLFHDFRVHRFGRNVHQREIDGARVGPDVARANRLHVPPEVGREV